MHQRCPAPAFARRAVVGVGAEGVAASELRSGAVTLVEPGDRVELGDRSLTSGRTQARGNVVRRDGDRWLIALEPGDVRPSGDDVTVRNGSHPVAGWLWHAHLRPAFSALWP